MSHVEGPGPSSDKPQPPKPPISGPNRPEALPPELLEKILSFLDVPGAREAGLVDKLFRREVVVAARNEGIEHARDLVNLLVQRLGEKYSEIAQLQKTFENHPALQAQSLLEVKTNLDTLKAHLVSLLSKVGEEDLNALEKDVEAITSPHFLHQLIPIARICSHIEPGNGATILTAVDELVGLGCLEEAFELSKSLEGTSREVMQEQLLERLVRAGQLSTAANFVDNLSGQRRQSNAILAILRALLGMGQLKPALDLLEQKKSLLLSDLVIDAEKEVVIWLVGQNRFREAIEHMRKNEGVAVVEIVRGLIKCGRIDEAAKVAEQIPPSGQQDEARYYVVESLVSRRDVAGAQRLIASMRNFVWKTAAETYLEENP